MNKSIDPYDRAVRSRNDSDRYEFSGESEYSRERSDPYQMVDYMIDKGFDVRSLSEEENHLSDDQIRERIYQLLARDLTIDISQIEIEIQDGVVYLKGSVDSHKAKKLSGLTLENLAGVKDIINQLQSH